MVDATDALTPLLAERVFSPREAAERLGVTRAMVVLLVKTGRLTWILQADGRHVLKARDVERFARTYRPGKGHQHFASRKNRTSRIAQDVFKLFAAGATLRQVVIETAVSPGFARELWAEWQTSLEQGRLEAERAEALARAQKEANEADAREHRRRELELKREIALAAAREGARTLRRVRAG